MCGKGFGSVFSSLETIHRASSSPPSCSHFSIFPPFLHSVLPASHLLWATSLSYTGNGSNLLLTRQAYMHTYLIFIFKNIDFRFLCTWLYRPRIGNPSLAGCLAVTPCAVWTSVSLRSCQPCSHSVLPHLFLCLFQALPAWLCTAPCWEPAFPDCLAFLFTPSLLLYLAVDLSFGEGGCPGSSVQLRHRSGVPVLQGQQDCQR